MSTAVYDHVIVNRLQMAGMDMVLRKFANLTDHLQLYVSVTSLYIYIYIFLSIFFLHVHNFFFVLCIKNNLGSAHYNFSVEFPISI